MNQDIRWKQRFANFQNALAQLTKFIDKGELNELEEEHLWFEGCNPRGLQAGVDSGWR